MRRIVLTVTFAAMITVPMLQSHTAPHGFAQTSGQPQSDEFNANTFQAPFTAHCGFSAPSPCPDIASATTWSLNQVSPGYLRIMTQPGTLVGQADNARDYFLQPVDPTSDYSIYARLTMPASGTQLQPAPLGQAAGIIVYGFADWDFIYFGRVITSGISSHSQLEFRWSSGPVPVDQYVSYVAEPDNQPQVELQLRKIGYCWYAAYRYNENSDFQPVSGGTFPTSTPEPTSATGQGGTPGLPPGYCTGGYPKVSQFVGLFAWGGGDPRVGPSNAVAADFDWFRVNDPAAPTPTATATSTPTPLPTSTPTITPAPTRAPTFTPLPTPTHAPLPHPTSTPTMRPTGTKHPKPSLKFDKLTVLNTQFQHQSRFRRGDSLQAHIVYAVSHARGTQRITITQSYAYHVRDSGQWVAGNKPKPLTERTSSGTHDFFFPYAIPRKLDPRYFQIRITDRIVLGTQSKNRSVMVSVSG